MSLATLRPYQRQLVDRVIGLVTNGDTPSKSVILQMPTGAGKTRCAMELMDRLPKPAIFLAHRRELIFQPLSAFKAAGIDVDVLTRDTKTAGWGASIFGADITVASQLTAYSRGVRLGHKLGEYKTIIADECHHATARTWREVFELWPDAILIGLTATPTRGDGNGLGDVFDDMVQSRDYGAGYYELIRDGYLVDAPTEQIWTWKINLKGVAQNKTDYKMGGEKGAAKRVNTQERVGDCVAHWLKLANGRSTIVYAASVDHAHNLSDRFRANGVAAEAVDGTTPKEMRDERLRQLGTGELKVVANYGVLTEGFDCPAVSCIILERPTKQFGLYLQMVGRGLRSAPGKQDLVILDHVGLCLPQSHGMPTQDVRWHLRATDPAATKDPASALPSETVRVCKQCEMLIKTPPCAFCGWMPAPNETRGTDLIKAGDGYLTRLSDQEIAKVDPAVNDTRRAEYFRLLGVAKRQKKGSAWVDWVYKTKHGEWPPVEWKLPNPEKVEQFDYYSACRKFAEKKGWKNGWAWYQYKVAYDKHPPNTYASAFDKQESLRYATHSEVST